MMPEMKTLNGYEVVDAKAREDIKELQNAGHATEEYVDEAIAAIPKPDYTGLATEAYVDNAIDNIPEVDLSKHALKSELPTKVSQLQNDSKFITREEVPETDLSAYAKKSEIPDVSDFITSIPSEYITESELNAKGYLTQHQDISGKADKNHKHTEYLTEHQDISHLAPKSSIPTKVSQLANDSNYLTSIPSTYITEAELEAKNYLTEHQSLTAYATKTFVENTVAENQPNLSGYAKKSDIPDVSDFISEIPSEYVTEGELTAKKYATESYVGEAIAQAQLGGEDVDLSDYAKKADVPTKTSQLTNDSNFITAIPAEYVTETELNNKGYLTQHQSLDGKADKVHEHTEYANKMHNHSMADITDYVAPEIPSLDGYATEKYVDNAVSNIDIPEVDVDTSVYALEVSNSDNTVTDEKTIQCLESIWAGTFLPCRISGALVTYHEKSLTSNQLMLYASTSTVAASPAILMFRRLRRNAENNWTIEVKNTYNIYNYNNTNQLVNGAGFVKQADIDTSLEGYATTSAVSAGYFPKTSGQQLEAAVAAIESTYATMDDFPVMTQSQYNALSNKDSNKFYFIKES